MEDTHVVEAGRRIMISSQKHLHNDTQYVSMLISYFFLLTPRTALLILNDRSILVKSRKPCHRRGCYLQPNIQKHSTHLPHGILNSHLGNRTPRHWNQDPALHALNQRYGLVNCISPTFHVPALLSSDLSLLEICKLPEVMNRV